jgi:hypothetical protein
MKVLQQLIRHFWARSALTLDQAHYLVEHGLIAAEDLGGYQPRDPVPAADHEASDAGISPRPQAELLGPDALDQAEEILRGPAFRKWKRGQSGLKVPDLTPEQLGERLEAILQARAACWPALAELAGLPEAGVYGREAAVALRHLEAGAFQDRLLRAVQARPGLLGNVWEALDVEPLYDLLDRPDVRGKAARGLAALLRSTPGRPGAAASALKVPAVQAVANLLAVRGRLVPAVRWLYDRHPRRLVRCVQRPARPRRSWDGLAFGLALLYNARAHLARRTPPGFPLERRLAADGWQEAWTVAAALDAAAVTPFCIAFFGRPPRQGGTEADSAAPGRELICPSGWKV